MEEKWRMIEFAPGYCVSNLGRVCSGEKIIPQHNIHGYKNVCLKISGKYKSFSVHRLVAMSFIPNPDNLPQVNHKDENKANNCVDNLEWCTALYNNTYGSRPDKIRASNSRRGCPDVVKDKIRNTVTEKQGRPVARLDEFGCVIKVYKSISEAQRDTGIRRQTIRAILNDTEHLVEHKSYWKYL